MALRLCLLAALLAAATAAPVITSSNNAHFRTLRPDLAAGERLDASPCDYCQNMVTTLESFVTDPQTQAAAAEYLDAVVCTALPADWGQMCRTEVPVLVAAAAQEVAESLQPGDVCGAFGVCPGGGGGALQGPLDCPMCKLVVVAFVTRLQDPESRAEIEKDMRAACDNLETNAKARCLQDVASLFSALDNLLHDVDPEGVCQVAEFCSKDGVAAAPVPAALRTLRSAVVALATGAPAAAANSDSCQSCKTIVSEAAAILSDPKTQAEVLDYAKEGCAMFQDFKDQCEAYVTLYGPLVLNMAISYLQPDSLCSTMGYCKAVDAPHMLS
ncbi:proactivator polypeptide-like [Micractinium conductrix]|uniref:Proactivator polypeptide-like n=1 Tax=Micractinium conductrix TaxID=554055 RepID=A0A2P6VC75_9CHLO|nr:proactivator polypeptide-like [Micractinium conductrix]|eukprot:PSC71700.1 proactivator polypeptide-like [Micractinium conductrix]